MPASRNKPPPRSREPLLAPDGSGLQTTFYTGLIFGPNGCGKTTVAEQISYYYHHLGGKVWAVDPNEAWTHSPGVKSLWPATGKAGIDEMLQSSIRWGPGLIVFDDADSYMRHSTEIEDNYLTRNRHFRKDLLVIARRPQGIPKDAIASARFVMLFAGSLTEVGARRYLSDMFSDEILSSVPSQEYSYLLLVRKGARWEYERRKTKPRKIKTKSDKT